MQEVDPESLPTQQGYKIDAEQLDRFNPYPAPDEEYPSLEEDESTIGKVARIIDSNEINVYITEGEPGDVFPWHTHSPELYQVYTPLQGTIAVNYVDNDRDTHRTEAEPEEYVYLPPGAQNKIEYLGPDLTRALVIARSNTVPRIEHLLGDEDGLYDYKEDPSIGLEVDSKRSRLIEKDETATEEY